MCLVGGKEQLLGVGSPSPPWLGGLTHVRPGQRPFYLLSCLLNPGSQVFVSCLFCFLHEEKFGGPVSRYPPALGLVARLPSLRNIVHSFLPLCLRPHATMLDDMKVWPAVQGLA